MAGKLLLGCVALSGNASDFAGNEFTLKSLTVKGIGGEYFRQDSQLGAWEIGSLTFGGQEPLPDGTIEFHELPRSKNVPGLAGNPVGNPGQYDLLMV